MITRKLQLVALITFVYLLASVIGKKNQGCQTTSSQGYYICNNHNSNGIFQASCNTYAILRANSDIYSSVTNLSSYLGISPSVLAQVNSFSSTTVIFSNGQPLLIPINCNCNTNGGIFEALVARSTIKGESFDDVSQSFEGLTTCQSIRQKNPNISPKNFKGGISISVPLRCACPLSSSSSVEFDNNLVSYPVKQGDTLSQLAQQFNVNVQTLVSANNLHSNSGTFNLNNNTLIAPPYTTLLIPVQGKPNFINFSPKSQSQSQNPNFVQPPPTQIQPQNSHKKKSQHHKNLTFLVVLIVVVLLISTAILSVVVIIYFLVKCWKKKRQDLIKNEDWDQLKGLTLSVRTSTDKKPLDESPTISVQENYLYEDLQKATEDFNSNNLIEGSVYHGRLNGKNLAIKRTPSHFISRINFRLLSKMMTHHHHRNMIMLLGTCVMDGPDSFVVFEYAENGSLKDWINGGLAIKSQFISSCNCFLNWKQRLKICLDVATALYYMHFTTNPIYVHRNIRSRNVFLDGNFNAKVGNLGMENCVEHVYEDQELCNKGYLAPEYVSKGVISPSVDVFAYGVVLLEVVSGKPAVIKRGDEGSLVKLCDEIKRVLGSEDEMKGWVDSAFLEDCYSFERAVIVARIGGACVEEEAALRPNAGEIVEKLLRLVEELPEDRDDFSFFK